jgi:hypothetical protein
MPTFENMGRRGLGQFQQNPLIPSFQHGVLEPRRTRMFPEASLQVWMPAIHADMTKIWIFISAGERKGRESLCGESSSTLNPEKLKLIVANRSP